MTKFNPNLPYFDFLLEEFRQGKTSTIEAFGRHVHWGYWESPEVAEGSVADFARAAEQLSQQVWKAGEVKEGDCVLDVGCGFGGTIASLNENFNQLQLTGLNLDDRQLERARSQVQPLNQNSITFVQGDACKLPFEDNSFDVVLAVECIFHFPSRQKFFQEAKRVLKPGGKLALSDFVPAKNTFPLLQLVGLFLGRSVVETFGTVKSEFFIADYRKLAQSTGFDVTLEKDITLNTVPTYPFLNTLLGQQGDSNVTAMTKSAAWISKLGWMRYLVLSFESEIAI